MARLKRCGMCDKVEGATILEALAASLIIIGALLLAIPLIGGILGGGGAMERIEGLLMMNDVPLLPVGTLGTGAQDRLRADQVPHDEFPEISVHTVTWRTGSGKDLVLMRTMEFEEYAADQGVHEH